MSADSAVSVALDVFKWVVVPIKSQLGYVMHSKKYDDDLRENVRSLDYEVDRIEKAMEEARRNLRSVYDNITEWQEKVEKALKDARELLGDFEKVSKNCCYGALPDPRCRYKFSRKAKDTIEGIQRLARECGQFKDISFNGPATGATGKASVVSATMSIKLRDAGIFESRAVMVRNMVEALADNNSNVVGIYGMGGLGKSTLLDKVKGILREETLFDWVAKADVSENPDIKTIQAQIADALGLTSIKDKESTGGRAELLHMRLKEEIDKKKKVLIMLDNLWKGLDLKSVGIPCGDDNKVTGCKLLLTSRDCKVLQNEMGCDTVFPLDGLQRDEAKNLFEGIVGNKVHDDRFKPWVEVALDKCAGVPFLIDAMAKRFKNAELNEWEDTLKKIEKSKDKTVNDLINRMLQWSHDKLEEEEKSLLRLCVIYGISKPSLENLVRYGFGLGLFQEISTMEEARKRMSSCIHTLRASSLLLDSEDVDGFRIHDLVREFIVSVYSRDHPLLVLNNNDKLGTELLKDKLKSCTAVCIPHVDMNELPEELICPEMQIYLHFTNKYLKVSSSYFNSMRKLMVLHLSKVCVTRSLSAFQFLKSLHTLCLEVCSIEDVTMIGELKGLHILSFSRSNIQRLPKEIGQLIELRLLDLNYCTELEIIEPDILGSLNQLEELYMNNSFGRWNTMEQTPPTEARLIELNNMKNLCTLHVSICDWRMLPEDLHVEKLTKYEIRIGGGVYREGSCKGSSVLELKWDPISDISQKGCIQTLLGKTDYLFLNGFSGNEQSICALSHKGFPKLKHLRVKNSPSIIYVLQSSFHTDFKILESLYLENLINLEKICGNHFSSKSFGALKVARVEQCHKMEVLFPLSLWREIPHLKEIRAINCPLMREIVEVNDLGKAELHSLHVLELRNLPNIKNFCTAETVPSSSTSSNQVDTRVAFFNGQQVLIPSLESLTMAGLPNLKEIWSNDCPLELSNLQFLEVSSCKSVTKVIDSRSFAKLHKLRTLKIKDCLSMQEIFGLDELDTTPSELSTIQISQLPSLRHIWNKNPCDIMRFHNIRKLLVENCNNLEFLFFPCMVQSLSQLRELTIKNCKKMKVIIMEEEELRIETSAPLMFSMLISFDIRNLSSLTCFFRKKCSQEAQIEDHISSTSLFNQQVAFPSLERLWIFGMGSIERIWDDQVVAESFRKLKSLQVEGCNKLVNVAPSCVLGRLRSLDNLEVWSCYSLEVVFKIQPPSPLDGLAVAPFPLQKLELYGLPRLKRVWDEEFHNHVKFQCLHSIIVSDCKSLTSLFPASAAIHLTQLEELEINDCGIVELIEEGELVLRDVFPKLTSLKLNHLTELKCVRAGPHALRWPALKTLEVNRCDKVEIFASHHEKAMPLCKWHLFLTDKVAFPSLETLWIGVMKIERIWDDQVAAESFHKLKSLRFHGCNKLVNIAPSCVLERLRSLESLEVKSCDSVEAVFKLQPVKPLDGHAVAPFPLRKLELYNLPGLKRVWDEELHSQVKFQCLRSITVLECQSLTSLFPVSVAMNLIQLEKLEIEQCGIVELIEREGLARGDTELHSRVKFQCLRSITVCGCWNLTSLFSASVAMNLIQLEELEIKECGIVELIEGEGLVRRDVFPRLSTLKLEHLTELKCVYANSHALCWPALKTLEVNGCDKVEIFASHHENGMPLHKQPLFLIEKGAFQNLQELKLNSFGPMEIWHGRFYDEELFCKLRLLELHNLSKEYAISTKRFVQSLTSLENLVLRNSYLEELSISMEAIDGQSHGRCFRHIKTLDVSCCDGFSKLFMSTIARNLVELTELRISSCKILTEVICEEGGEEELVLVFSQLKCIELKALTALECFSSTKYNLKFPLLENVIVNGCPHMKFFSNGLIDAPKLERVHVSTDTWFWKENLNITIQNMFEEMVTIVGQKVLQLSEFPELIEKWHSKLNPIKSSCELENLIVDKCPSFINGISSKLMLVLEKMKMLQVCNCESLEELFGLEELEVVEASRMPPLLWTLNLVNLPRLKRLWNKDLQGMMCFKCIHNLYLYNCSNLRHALVPSMAQCLPYLHVMEIKKCGRMEGVIVEEEGRESVAEKITFPNLWLLRLEWLPNLTSFLLGKNLTLDCPVLNGLTIAHCPKMRSLTGQTLMDSDHSTPSLFSPQVRLPPLSTMVLSHMDNLRKIWTDNPRDPPNFKHLQKVEVENCKQLENLFPHWVVTNLSYLEELRVESCEIEEVVANEDDTSHSIVTQILFPQLNSLVFHDMPQLKSFCPTFPTLNCPILKELRVTHCDKLNMLSLAASINKWAPRDDQHDLSDHEARSLFDMGILTIEGLLLIDKDIQTIQNGKFFDDFFDNTKSLTLACFHDEKTSFPSRFLLQRFPNLQNLEIYCCSFEDIFLDEVLVDEGKNQVLANLRELKLSKLHNLKLFWREDDSITKILQSIDKFEVWDCPDLTILFPITTSFWNLTELVVKNSSGLVHLMTTSVLKNLVNLYYMTVIGCERMKEVVVNDGDYEGKVISLVKLGRLKLEHLPSLECFSSIANCSFRFPSLMEITVEECPQMKIFSKGIVSTPILHSAKLFQYRWEVNWEGDLNTAIQKLSA